MNYNIIASSSKGNCIIVEKMLMLDCGVSYKKIIQNLKDIKLIFISHQHKDHILPTTIKKIAFNYPNIKFVTGSGNVVQILVLNGVPKTNIFILSSEKWYDLGIIKIKLETLQHDVCNYALKWEYKNKLGLYVVDTSKISQIKAHNYDLYLIEANYREDILKKHIEECENQEELYYLNRVPRTHLSVEQANSFLIENMGENSQFQYVHQSEFNYKEMEE